MDPSRQLIAEYSTRAAEYASHWAPVIQPMGRPILRELPLAAARCVLDLGAGTGSLLAELTAFAPGARILGVDASEGMLRIARASSDTALAVMSAERLALRSETIDVATIVFVLFHVPDPIVALRELYRVSKAGATLGVVVWGPNSEVPGAEIWKEELDRLGARPDERDPSVSQRERMDTPQKLAALLEPAGWTKVRAWSARAEHRFTLESAAMLHHHCGASGRRARTLSKETHELCQARARARLGPDEFVYRPEIVFAVGERG